MPTDYSGPITTVAPSAFDVITALTGKYLLTSDGKRILWSEVLTLLSAVFDGSETKINGTGVTGSGTTGDPYVIAASGGSGGTSTVVVDNLAQLPGVGTQGVVYFVFDKDGSGTNGIYTWSDTLAGYEDMTPGGAGGAGLVSTTLSATGLSVVVDHSGTAPTLVKNADGDYTLNCASDFIPAGIKVIAADGSAATDANNFIFRIAHPGGDKFRDVPRLVNLDTGLMIWNWQAAGGFSGTAAYSSNVTTFTITGIGVINFQLNL